MDENFWIKIDFLRTDDADLMDAGEGWDVTFNFVVEGVLLLLVAGLGLAGNLTSFVILMRQKAQKIFHNLLFLLSTFDTVSEMIDFSNLYSGNYGYFKYYLLYSV